MLVRANDGTVKYRNFTGFTRVDSFIDKEVPSGFIDGYNTIFTLDYTPILNSEHIYLNGILQDEGSVEDYTITGNTIEFIVAPSISMKIKCSYRK